MHTNLWCYVLFSIISVWRVGNHVNTSVSPTDVCLMDFYRVLVAYFRVHLQRGFAQVGLEFLRFTPAQGMGPWCKKEEHPSSTTRMAALLLPVSRER